MLNLHGTHCIHTPTNVRKNEIHLIVTLCFTSFCSLFVKFLCKSCKINGEEKLYIYYELRLNWQHMDNY